ncbi:hypothetical protein [Sorangium sp. So ce1335]
MRDGGAGGAGGEAPRPDGAAAPARAVARPPAASPVQGLTAGAVKT